MCECACVSEQESYSVCLIEIVCERVIVCEKYICVCMCVCVCERERESVCVCVKECVC